MKNLLIIAFAFLIVNPSFSQVDEQDILDTFFETFKTNPTDAVDYLYGTSKWIDGDGDAVRQIKARFSNIEELLGEYVGEEVLSKARLGTSYVSYVYFAKFERQPLRLSFEFYKAKDDWAIFSFKFDDSFGDDFEEVTKYIYMNSRM